MDICPLKINKRSFFPSPLRNDEMLRNFIKSKNSRRFCVKKAV
nr:MAG TPA: hypothetical protein [Caudoviricetes sp.]